MKESYYSREGDLDAYVNRSFTIQDNPNYQSNHRSTQQEFQAEDVGDTTSSSSSAYSKEQPSTGRRDPTEEVKVLENAKLRLEKELLELQIDSENERKLLDF